MTTSSFLENSNPLKSKTETGLPSSVEHEAATAELNGDNSEIQQFISSIDIATEDVNSLIQIKRVLNNTADKTKPIDSVAFKLSQIAVENIEARLGIKRKPSISGETFSTSGKDSTVSIESISDTIKQIWKAIVKAFNVVWEKIKSFLGISKRNTSALSKRVEEAKVLIKQLEHSPSAKNDEQESHKHEVASQPTTSKVEAADTTEPKFSNYNAAHKTENHYNYHREMATLGRAKLKDRSVNIGNKDIHLETDRFVKLLKAGTTADAHNALNIIKSVKALIQNSKKAAEISIKAAKELLKFIEHFTDSGDQADIAAIGQSNRQQFIKVISEYRDNLTPVTKNGNEYFYLFTYGQSLIFHHDKGFVAEVAVRQKEDPKTSHFAPLSMLVTLVDAIDDSAELMDDYFKTQEHLYAILNPMYNTLKSLEPDSGGNTDLEKIKLVQTQLRERCGEIQFLATEVPNICFRNLKHILDYAIESVDYLEKA